jgi:hypothetical protein
MNVCASLRTTTTTFSMAADDIAELTAQLSVLQAKLGVHSTGLKLWSV